MIYLKFLWSLVRHKWFVFRAGLILHVPMWRLLVHDLSKFSPSEFGRYARNFQGDYSSSPNDREKVSLEFSFAWLHHENRNRHHWEYWIPRTEKEANEPLPMPEIYVREMIADLLGVERAYVGSWNIASWLNANGVRWKIHDETLYHITTCMFELGYMLTGNCDWSWAPGDRTFELFYEMKR